MSEGTVPWWHMFHRWSKWDFTVTDKGRIVQTRECAVCGKAQARWA